MEKRKQRDIETMISLSLKIGVLCSAAIIAAGFLLFLFTGRSGYAGGVFPTDPLSILQGIAAFKSYAVILLGLFVLILTPVFRVGFSIFLFLKEKDHAFVKITALVFAILIVSFLLGAVE